MPLSWSPAPMARRRAHPQGCDPLSDPDLAGAFPPLWPGAGLSPRAPPTAHIWKEFEGEWEGGKWKDAGGRRGMWGSGGTGEGRGPLYLEPGHRLFPRHSSQLVHTSTSLQTEKLRPREGQRSVSRTRGQVRQSPRVHGADPAQRRALTEPELSAAGLVSICQSSRLPPGWDSWTEEGVGVGRRGEWAEGSAPSR